MVCGFIMSCDTITDIQFQKRNHNQSVKTVMFDISLNHIEKSWIIYTYILLGAYIIRLQTWSTPGFLALVLKTDKVSWIEHATLDD